MLNVLYLDGHHFQIRIFFLKDFRCLQIYSYFNYNLTISEVAFAYKWEAQIACIADLHSSNPALWCRIRTIIPNQQFSKAFAMT